MYQLMALFSNLVLFAGTKSYSIIKYTLYPIVIRG